MKFNKALLSLAVAGALATPAVVNAKAQIVVNDSTEGLPLSQQDILDGPKAQVVGLGIRTFAASASNDDVTVDEVYVRDNGDNTANTNVIKLDGPMPSTVGRENVSVVYSTDVQLPDEGTLKFSIVGAAGGFNPATAKTAVLMAQKVSLPTIGAGDAEYDADGAGAGAPVAITFGDSWTDVDGSGTFNTGDIVTIGGVAQAPAVAASTLTTVVDVAGGAGSAGSVEFVQVGQSFDYANTNGAEDPDVEYITFQIDTDQLTDNDRFVLDSNLSSGVAGVGFAKTTGEAGTDAAGDVYTLGYNSLADGTGTSFTGLRVSDGTFIQGDSLPRDIQMYVAQEPAAAGEYTPIDFVVSEGAAVNSTVSIEVDEAANTAGLPIAAALAEEELAITIVNGLRVDITSKATSLIDVEAEKGSRLQFVAEGLAGAGDTDLDKSRATIKLVNTADYGVTLDAGDSFEVAISRPDGENVDGVETITIDGQEMVGANGVWKLEDINFTGANSIALETGAEIEITVDEENILYPNVESFDWVTTVSVNNDGADDGEAGSAETLVVPVTGDGETHLWSINGLQAKIPYLYHINSSDWSSVVKVVNEASNSANISADVVLSALGNAASVVDENGVQTKAMAVAGTDWAEFDGTDLAGETFNIESLAIVPAEGHVTFNGQHIIEKIFGADAEQVATNYHIEITMLVEAAQNKVHVAAQNKNPEGRADSPVLYNINQQSVDNCVNYQVTTGAGSNLVAGDATTTCTSRTVDGRVWQ